MFKLFKVTFYGYIITSLLGVIAFVSTFFLTNKSNFLFLVMVPLWPYCCVVLFSSIALKRYQRNVYVLLSHCQVQDFIEENEKLLKNKQSDANAGFIKLNLLNGYLYLGNTGQVKKLSRELQKNLDIIPGGIMAKSVFYGNMCELYTCMRDYEKARKSIKSLKNLVNDPKIKLRQRDMVLHVIEEKEMILNVYQNHFDGTKEYFTKFLTKADSQIGKVAASYYLAQVCLNTEEQKEASSHLQFVVENGGDTYYVNKAKRAQLNK